jgi:N-acetylated-alpha-linked acidic dipeptidase
MSQLWGVLALRLANADLLPFDFATYASNIRQFVNELEKNNEKLGADKHMWGQPPSAVQPGEARQPPPLDLKPVLDAIDAFEAAGQRLNASAARALSSGTIDPKLAATINHGAMQVERNWLNPDGIPGRPWFKHILYGARYTYAHLELPGLTEAVEKQDWPTAQQQAEILRQTLVNNTKLVNELNAALNGEPGESTKQP